MLLVRVISHSVMYVYAIIPTGLQLKYVKSERSTDDSITCKYVCLYLY